MKGKTICVGFAATACGLLAMACSQTAVTGMTEGRARANAAAIVGLISVVIAGLAYARSSGQLGTGSGRIGAMVGLLTGLIAVGLSVVHLTSFTGGFGTGGGRAGAIVALVLGLIGMAAGGLALVRTRRNG